ncbi:MAG: pilus assembly protein [Proteobacteria bacterium]|nr:pilus assembly protein [Pseudomonadota bacterium]
MIVIAIIGILAAIAVPQFVSYRLKGYNTAGGSDTKNASIAQEAYYDDNKTYTSSCKCW